MPTAHRHKAVSERRATARKNRLDKNKKRSDLPGKILKFVLPLLIVLLVFLFISFSSKNWNGRDKFSFVFKTEDGNVGVTVLDPVTPEMTTLYIPGDTEVSVAAGYGTMRIKNVWQLGVNEKRSDLLVRTVTKNFLTPVYLWTDTDGELISRPNFAKLARFVLFPIKTNIPFGDRINMALFAVKIKNIEKGEIDLAKSQFLHKETLNDGQKGYALAGPPSARITVYFADNYLSEKNTRVNIIDGSKTAGSAQKVGEVIEVMGGKVVSIEKNQEISEDTGCEVRGTDSQSNNKVAKVFGCTVKNTITDYDIEVVLGPKFVRVF